MEKLYPRVLIVKRRGTWFVIDLRTPHATPSLNSKHTSYDEAIEAASSHIISLVGNGVPQIPSGRPRHRGGEKGDQR